MDWILTLSLGAILTLIIYWWGSLRTNYWKNRGIPHVKALPFIGNSLDLILQRKGFAELVVDVYNQFKGERFAGYFLFTSPVLVIRDPELINQVMVKNFNNFHDRGLPTDEKLEPLSGSVANLTGEQWRIVRHNLTPTFTSGKLKMMFSEIFKCSKEAMAYIKLKGEKAMEVKSIMIKFNLNVIGSIAFGLKIDAFNENDEKSNNFVRIASSFFAPSSTTLLKFIFRMCFPKLGVFMKAKLADEEVDNFFINLVHDTIEYREKTKTRRNDFLQLLIDIRDKESKLTSPTHSDSSESTGESINQDQDDQLEAEDKELLDQLQNIPYNSDHTFPVFTEQCLAAQSFVFITGGSETTSTVLSFAVYELAANKDVHDRLQTEVNSILSSRPFDYEALKEMKFMDQVINEVLRLHPVGGAIGRICTEDFLIPGTDKVIEKGTLINIPVLALHKDPQYFPEPEKFNPDRFKDMQAIPKGVFLPFGAGPRMCIAMRLALLEMKICLATVMASFNLTVSEKTKVPLKLAPNSIIQNVIGGIWIEFEVRKHIKKVY